MEGRVDGEGDPGRWCSPVYDDSLATAQRPGSTADLIAVLSLSTPPDFLELSSWILVRLDRRRFVSLLGPAFSLPSDADGWIEDGRRREQLVGASYPTLLR